MIQTASETILKYAAALVGEDLNLTFSILHEVSGEVLKSIKPKKSDTNALKSMLNNKQNKEQLLFKEKL